MLNLPNSCVIALIFLNLAAPVSKMINTSLILLLLSITSVRCNVTCSMCTQQEIGTAYLDAAVDMIVRKKHNIAIEMITKAKYYFPSDYVCPQRPKDCTKCPKEYYERPKIKPVDCADVLDMGYNTSDVYRVWPMNRLSGGKPVAVYCDMDTDGGGWTVIQRRGDFETPKDYFYKGWKSYKDGFGKLLRDFWLGNDNIFILTNEKHYSVRFDLMDVEKNRRYAHYDNFWIDEEELKYKLHISGYTGDAGDAMKVHNKMAFSTNDRDNDKNFRGHCAEGRRGAWWHNSCGDANLNALYHKGKYKEGTFDGMYWYQWKGWYESLEWTEIKIRPKHFRARIPPQV